VLNFKGPPRNIINRAYQNAPDNIVGQMTIKQLDKEMDELERTTPNAFVSVTKAGAPHDHTKCPPMAITEHLGTPINPQRFGRMINIFGENETFYLGFKDFSTDVNFQEGAFGGVRPLTFRSPQLGGLPDKCASDICIGSSPITDENFTRRTGRPNTPAEIKRIAMHGCRLTHFGPKSNIEEFGHLTRALGAARDGRDNGPTPGGGRGVGLSVADGCVGHRNPVVHPSPRGPRTTIRRARRCRPVSTLLRRSTRKDLGG
jgi:hypothetical protein